MRLYFFLIYFCTTEKIEVVQNSNYTLTLLILNGSDLI